MNSLSVLSAGGKVTIDGVNYKRQKGVVKEGVLCVGERNLGPRVFTVESINREMRFVIPKEHNIYPYDIHECIPVEIDNN